MDPASVFRALQTVGTVRSIGLDIDGTITADPPLFAQLARTTLDRGGRVLVVTSRSILSRAETIRELASYRLRYSSLHFLPAIEEGAAMCPHVELDWFHRYLWGKIAIAKECAVTDFVDDDPRVIGLFHRYFPHINGWLIT